MSFKVVEFCLLRFTRLYTSTYISASHQCFEYFVRNFAEQVSPDTSSVYAQKINNVHVINNILEGNCER